MDSLQISEHFDLRMNKFITENSKLIRILSNLKKDDLETITAMIQKWVEDKEEQERRARKEMSRKKADLVQLLETFTEKELDSVKTSILKWKDDAEKDKKYPKLTREQKIQNYKNRLDSLVTFEGDGFVGLPWYDEYTRDREAYYEKLFRENPRILWDKEDMEREKRDVPIY